MYDEAIRTYDKAIETASPGSFYTPTAWISKGNALRAQGKNEEALEAYNKAISLSPIFAEAWLGRGEAQKALGRLQRQAANSICQEVGV
jgi:tetratricopeptide (TPR) repeat protein